MTLVRYMALIVWP